MKWQLALALVATFALSAQAQFVENFDDAGAAGRWSGPIVDAETGTFDGVVDYAFDYGAIGLPSAPSGGGLLGVQFIANTNDEPGDEGEAIGIIANDAVMPASDFVLKMDAYYLVTGSAGSATEFITLGAFTADVNAPGSAGLDDDAPFRFVGTGNGLAWQVSGDGGSSQDLIRFEDPGNLISGTSGITTLGSLDAIPFGTIPGVTTGGGNPNDPFEEFGMQNRWVTISIESTGGFIDYKINGAVIDTLDNTGGAFNGGSIMVGLTDVFSSSAGTDVSVIIDNVMLTTVPEPTSLLLGAMALCGLATTRRRF